MNTKETLLAISMTTIATGTALIQTNVTNGMIMVVVGIALIFIRGYLKVK